MPTREEAKALLVGIPTANSVGLRDRALIGLLLYTFARVSAALAMRVEDYYPVGRRWWVRLHEKGDKHHEMPAHHRQAGPVPHAHRLRAPDALQPGGHAEGLPLGLAAVKLARHVPPDRHHAGLDPRGEACG
jgi:integrase